MKKLFFSLLLFVAVNVQAQYRIETNLWVKTKLKMIGAEATAISTDSITHYGIGTKLITERAAKAYARLAAVTFGGGGGGITDGPKGDINVTGFGANWKLNDTIVTDNLTGLGQSFQVFRPAGQSYLSATLSPYGVNVFGDSFKKTLIQDGQINLQNSNPFINIKTQTSGVALGIDTIVKHYYIDMIDNLQFSIEQQSLPFLHFTGRNSALYPAPYRGILYLANANTDNVVIGDINAGDLGLSKAHKDSKLTVFGNLKVASDTFKLNGKFFANNLPVAKRAKQLFWNPADSTISTEDTVNTSLSTLGAATAANTIANGNNLQTWNWTGVGSGSSALKITNNNVGSTLELQAGGGGTALNITAGGTSILTNGAVGVGYPPGSNLFSVNGARSGANYLSQMLNTDISANSSGLLVQTSSSSSSLLKLNRSGGTTVFEVKNTGTAGEYYFNSLQKTASQNKIIGFNNSNKQAGYLELGGGLKINGDTFDVAGQTILTRPGIHKEFSVTKDTITFSVDTVSASNIQTASYTLTAADQFNTWVVTNVGSANNVTVPPNSSVAFPIGTEIPIEQRGAGQTTIVAGSGVTINSAGAKLKVTGQYSTAMLRKTANDTWLLFGDISN